jgi:hypothetical protein
MKIEVKPTLSSTWSITAQSYNRNESCILSNDEDVSIADISIKRFFQFLKEQNITLIGNKLVGTYIIGNDRSLYTVDMYNEWREKFDKRVETSINKNDLIEGHLYKTVCGSIFLYLGKRNYISARVKDTNVKLSKQGTAYFILPYFDSMNISSSDRIPERLKQNAVKDLGMSTFEREGWEERAIKQSQSYGDNPYFYIGIDKLDDNALIINTSITDHDNYRYNIISDGTSLYCSRAARKYNYYGSGVSSDRQVANKPIILDQSTRTLMCFNWSFGNENYKTMDHFTFFNRGYKNVHIILSN